ncbi:MAG: ribose 5-phosphate isomerase B [Candidatus Cloacimonadota bacterium]|nr:ribose 5-phosphate isomerase B [Candidatus Cloacimonadota bacterium]
MKKIIIASDHAGFELKGRLLDYLHDKYVVEDAGTYTKESCDYPDVGFPAAEKVAQGLFDAGILICGSGIGMSIVANKVKNIRGALCTSPEIAKLSRQHNNSNILILPGRFIDFTNAKKVVDVWLKTGFAEGRHHRRIKKIQKYEEQ